jgi:GNAT superfamily N-acetyltransferase
VRAQPVIRPLTAADVDAANAVAWDALQVHIPAEHFPADDDERRRRGRLRIGHLLETDPGGAWVADADGEVVGIALALVREGLWGLSLFAVAPARHGQGIGARLLEPALADADGARGAIILSSVDPRAMRRYARAGFALRPCVCASGIVDRAAIPAGLRSRPGDPVADRELCDVASRAVRGAAHGEDVGKLVEADARLLVLHGDRCAGGDSGFVLVQPDGIALLAATSESAARDLLWSGLAATRHGSSVTIDFITAGQDWAVDVALAANLALSPDGPVFVRGDVGSLAPYLPSGAYL